jgi:nicotinamidase-related amidase
VEAVIATGTSAHGAVLHTAMGAALRGLKVYVPVDCMSAGEPFAELYTAWHMLNAPGTRRQAVLTRSDMIRFAGPPQGS